MGGTDLFTFFDEYASEANAAHHPPTPAEKWNQDSAKRALDELFTLTQQYSSSKSYHELIKFTSSFRFYSPYNAMLVHIQMPGARYVAPPHRWHREFSRRIKPGARTLVLLQPMGPVMFAYDVSDTEPLENAPPLPPEVTNPFEVKKGTIGKELDRVIENAKRDGIKVIQTNEGSQSAGSISQVANDVKIAQDFQTKLDQFKKPIFEKIAVKYTLLVNEKMSHAARYATIVHELAHLYCGHLGTPNIKWWPDRRKLSDDIGELEAESVTFLVCTRLGIDSSSEQYLAGYVKKTEQMPSISLECVMKAAGLIETMSHQRMKPRKKEDYD